MERLSRHAAAAHFNMCNGAEIVFSLAYTVALWYNVFTILRKARWLDVVCSLNNETRKKIKETHLFYDGLFVVLIL